MPAKVELPNHYFHPTAQRDRSRCFMSLTLYAHPFSSYCKKVLVALYENNVPFEYRTLEEPSAMAEARRTLDLAYGWLEQRLEGRTWVAGETMSMADCAAAPSLFYADWVHPIAGTYPTLRAYRSRLLAWPSFARAVDEARPYRHYFPLGAPDRD